MSRIVLDPQREAQLRKTFNVAGAEMAAPTELSDTVQFVHEVLGGPSASALFGAPSYTLESDTAANGVTTIASAAIPAGFLNWVHGAALTHNEAVTHRGALLLTNTVAAFGAGAILETSTFDNTAGNSVSIHRNIVVPSGFFIRGDLDAIGAGNRPQLSLVFLQVPIGTPFPTF